MTRALMILCGVLLPALVVLGDARAQCAGDCDGNGKVIVNELITCVAIALDQASVGQCSACDDSGDQKVAVNELVAAVNAALGVAPCGTPQGSPTPTATPSNTPSSTDMTTCCVAAYYVWACEQHTVADCATLQGVDNGPTGCDPNPCGAIPPSDQHGICCLPNATGEEVECEDRKATDCAAAGGVVKPTGTVCTATTCADVPPPNPDVACCQPNASGVEIECEDRPASACAAAGGVNKGPGACAVNTCADVLPPTIQCCVTKQSGTVVECEDVTAAQCTARGGVDMGAGACSATSCAP